ncbi:MAG TPA: hypothetical protein VGR07_09415 [Thermoanaerobaculia bacterium]|jgi:hypothetical protein|nr:hypothetical protein [Thermoanaerobaculia bacterium]
MICPKCGFAQPDGATDCARCGVLFARYSPPILPVEPLPATPAETLYGDPLPPPPPPQMPGRLALPSPHAFEIGALLGETFRTYFANFLPFLILTGFAFLPLLLYTLASNPVGVTPQGKALYGLVSLFLRLLCGPLATATIAFGVFQQMRGRDTSIAECMRVGLSNLLPVLAVASAEAIAIGVGAVFCLVPGLICASMYAVSVPVAVEERPGVLASLNRSGVLTEGYRWRVFCVLFLLGILGGVAGLAVNGALLLLLAGTPRLAALLQELLGVVASGISATAVAVMYYRLRSVKESIDVESIASVFD